MSKIPGAPSPDLVSRPQTAQNIEESEATSRVRGAPTVRGHGDSDSIQAHSADAAPAEAPRLQPPSPAPVVADTEGAQSFAASLDIWAQYVQPSEAATEDELVRSAFLTNFGSEEISADELDFLIARIMGTSGDDMKYWDEYFARVLAHFRKKKDIKLEAVSSAMEPQLAMKYLPGGFHSVGMPTERNASYELIEASQRVADLVSALSELGGPRPGSITG